MKIDVSFHPKIMGGVVRFKDTRIPIDFVIQHFKKGWSGKEIKKFFPDVESTVIDKIDNYLKKHDR